MTMERLMRKVARRGGGAAAGSETPREIEPAQPPHHPRGFPDDSPVHLRDPDPAVHERDRNLDHPVALSPALVVHLDLERVAVAAHPVQVDRRPGFPANALEPAGGVADLR